MTERSLNPFPDYAVTRLAAGQDANVVTVETPPIVSARKLVKEYLGGLSTPTQVGKTNAALCAVRGDYGTGKTHLLNDAASQIQAACASSVNPSILRATCIEVDPLSWFRAKVGPPLDELPLYEVTLKLYGFAGQVVAERTELTESAADLLQEDPTRIRDLIRDNSLSVDEVGREFQEQLGVICKEYDQTVRRVLSCLVSSETEGPARKWISGAALSAREAELLGVSESIDSADQASSIIGAIAAIHKAVGRPFILLVDELEHFTRYDSGHNSWANVTWLKRLLERLGNAGALALVAGHWSAWQTNKDYLDRFPQYAPIDLVRLEPDDVIRIMEKQLGAVPEEFDPKHANTIATVTDGNMRRVMSLCNFLFRKTYGFKKPLSEKQIHEVWTSVAQRIPQQQALEQIVDLLEPHGFDVKLDASFDSIPFDLVAEKHDGHTILIQAKHSSTQSDHYDAARHFIDKLASVTTSAPHTVGMFLANGSIDDDLLGILRDSGLSSLRWFDLTTRNVMDDIKTEIDLIDDQTASNVRGEYEPGPDRDDAARKHSRPAEPDASRAENARLEAMNAEFELKLQELEERRYQETRSLMQRLDALAEASKSQREESVRSETEIKPERARVSYEAMLEEPTLNRKLRYLGNSLVIGVAYIGIGFSTLLANDSILKVLETEAFSAEVMKFPLILISFSILGMGLWAIWRRYSQLADYLEFSRQTIRDLYLRDVAIEDLTRVNTVMRGAIDHYGPYRAREMAVEILQSNEFSKPIRYYFHDVSFLRDKSYSR